MPHTSKKNDKPVDFYGPIAQPGPNARLTLCPIPSSGRAQNRLSKRDPFQIYEHAQCRVFERTSLQRAYVIPCQQQMGSSAVLRACRNVLVLAAWTVVSCPYLRYGDRADFKMYLLRQFWWNRVKFFTIHRRHRRKK